jgi:GWxTD domain-containing protein
MTFLNLWIDSPWAGAFGWTLVHTLWEGAAVALALALVLSAARTSRARYAAACVAMLGLAASFGVTLYLLAPSATSLGAAVRPIPVRAVPATGGLPFAAARAWDPAGLLPWLAPCWLAGVVLFQLRCLAAWIAAVRLRRRGVCGADARWVENLSRLQARLRMTKHVALLESCFAEVPVVIGHLRPVILMPVGLLTQLPAGQIEAILLHELAHIRRADYLVNLLQTVAEGLVFYHPAVWWISGVIRSERENCCDDVVVSTSGNAHEYASALAALAENRWGAQQTVLAATGGDVLKRIRRLLAPAEGPRTTIAPVVSAGILVVTGAAAMGAWQNPAPAALAGRIPSIRTLAFARPQAAPQPKAVTAYDRWLKEEVVYIITDKERADFKALQSDAERERFIAEFWERRDPTPGTAKNEFKEEHYRRIEFVNRRFSKEGITGWKTDRGRIYIEYGPPDEIDSHPSGGPYTRPAEEGGTQVVTYPFEMWRYRHLDGIGDNIILEFVDKDKTGRFRMTTDPSAKVAQALATGRLPFTVVASYQPLSASGVMTKIQVRLETKDLLFGGTARRPLLFTGA